MTTTPDAVRRKPVAAILLFGIACALDLILMTNILESHGSDAAGRGLAAAYTAVMILVLWTVLAALLLIGAMRGSMPAWAIVAAVILVPLSALAVFIAADHYGRDGGWWIVAPALLPPLIACYALWARVRPLNVAISEPLFSAVSWGAILVLSVTPPLMSYLDSLPNSARAERERLQVERLRQEEQDAIRREARKFENLGPHSSLRDYLEYLPPGDTRHRQAIEGARQVASRQADAAALLRQGRIGDLQDLWRLDVAATPELCEAFGSALRGEASKIDKSRSDYLIPAMRLEQQMPNLKWLVAERCDLGEPLSLVESRIKAVSDSPRMDELAAALAALHKPR
jgi:hypothetical protein